MDGNQPNISVPQSQPEVSPEPQRVAQPEPQPMTEPKKKSNKALWIVILLAVLAVAAAAGGVYYYMDMQNKNDKSALNNQINDLNSQIAKLQSTSTSSKTATLTDTESLNYLTIAKLGTSASATIAYAPQITAKDSEWAITSVITVEKGTSGWTVPARGYSEVLWRKVNGVWTEIGSHGDIGPWDKNVQALYSQIPATIIPTSQRYTGDSGA